MTERYCHDGRVEQAVYQAGTHVRIDCITSEYAIEVEFADNWSDAIGQALNYAQVSRPLRAGIILVCRMKNTCTTHGIRLTTTIKNFRLPISVWYCDLADLTRNECVFDPEGIPFR